jgi:hypothetical protein
MLLLFSVVAAAAPWPCGTLERLPHAPPLATPFRAAAPPEEPGLRDPYGVSNVETSSHFAVWWGTAQLPEGSVASLLNSLEVAWSVQITNMGHPAPFGTDQWLFNVYIGDSGEGAPSIDGAAGYYTVDLEGMPMIVIAPEILDDEDGLDAVAIHEFYHAIQGSLGRYSYTGLGAWYWEATAEWAAVETHPVNPAVGSLTYGYVLLPDLPVNFFDYPDSGALQEAHQYGAFLLPYYLTDLVGSDLVRDSWIVPGPIDDPLEVLRAGLADRGLDFDAVWLDHIATNAAWDFPMGDLWAAEVAYLAGYVGGRQYTAWWEGDGRFDPLRLEGWGTAPGRYGYNVFVLDAPRSGEVAIEIVGDETGDAGSPASFGAQLVHVEGYDATYTDVPFDGTTARAAIPVDGADQLILVVGAWTAGTSAWERESFPYSLTMSIGDPPDPGAGGVDMGLPAPPEPVPTACAHGTPAWGLWTVAGLVALRRRR